VSDVKVVLLEEHHPCHKCKVFRKFMTSLDRALACETARAVDNCYLIKLIVGLRNLRNNFPKFEQVDIINMSWEEVAKFMEQRNIEREEWLKCFDVLLEGVK